LKTNTFIFLLNPADIRSDSS